MWRGRGDARMPDVSLAVAFAATRRLSVPAHAAFPGKSGRIAFESSTYLYTMNSDGSDVRQVGPFGGNPHWSPDGTQILSSFDTGVYVMNADGSGFRRLFTGRHANWSPDGRQIVYDDG